MTYTFSVNTYDYEGDLCEKCILAHVGNDTILKFQNSQELEDFAKAILGSLKEIRESEVYRGKEFGGDKWKSSLNVTSANNNTSPNQS